MKTRGIAGLIGIAAVALVAAGNMAPGGTESTWRMPRVVRLHTSAVFTYFPASLFVMSAAVGGEPQGLLLRDGDLVAGDSTLFIYRDSDGPELTTGIRSGIVSVGGVPVSMGLNEIGARGWLDRASTAELARLRLVGFADSIPAGLWPAIRRLAAANPNVGMSLGSSENAAALLTLFKPTLLVVGEWKSDPLPSLADQSQLETLLIPADDSGALDGLDRLPKLRQLFLGKWDADVTGPLPEGMKALRSLVATEWSGDSTLAPLHNAPPELEELSLLGARVTDISGVRAFPELRTLLLNHSPNLTDLRPLAALTKLQWLGLPPKTSQAQFDAIVISHPALKIIDLTSVEGVTDLASLKGLKDLRALILSDTVYDLRALPDLKTLQFVGVGAPSKDSAAAVARRVAAVRKALPDALVVPMSPMCLGSGWILLLLPVVALFWCAATRSRPRTLASAVSG